MQNALWMSGWLAVAVLSAAEKAGDVPGLVWATEAGAGAGSTGDVEKLRAKRFLQPMAGYLYSEEVVWHEYRDVAQYKLLDGRRLTVDLNGLKWERVNAWPKGKKLTLCYDEARGATLVDPETKHVLLVRGLTKANGQFVHPIDRYLEALDPVTTLDMMSVSQEAQRLWRLEIDRTVREILGYPHLPKDVRAQFIALTKTRLDYCKQQSDFGSAAIRADITGTAAGPMSGNYAERVYRDAYAQLVALAESYVVFKNPEEK
jgi:hypothetical protein